MTIKTICVTSRIGDEVISVLGDTAVDVDRYARVINRVNDVSFSPDLSSTTITVLSQHEAREFVDSMVKARSALGVAEELAFLPLNLIVYYTDFHEFASEVINVLEEYMDCVVGDEVAHRVLEVAKSWV